MSLSADEMKALQKEVSKKKRIATEWAGQMHDLAEERLPIGFEEIHTIAKATYDACLAWKEAADKLQAAESEAVSS
ncbi:CCE_0567 family metalloprotein [Blastopirellula marina]|uniref:Rop family plasmid primer RNA-binding protein n=1 Tax=Blastopirellula marina TaxID=124 RepID=A0A2S8GNF5_9BACT|nr:CCE_0567 family metalloprotein [Blastopirellula marina]PQO45942.1 hypothetical protein C5Y93_11875 [Blastopirellula marina]